jgi:hypothetical protein
MNIYMHDRLFGVNQEQPWVDQRNGTSFVEKAGSAAFDQFVISGIPIVGPFVAMFGRRFGLFGKGKETHDSRAAGAAHLDPKADLEQLNQRFLQTIEQWKEHAKGLKDPTKRAEAIARLNQIEAAWKLGVKTLEGVKSQPEKYEYAFSQLFGQSGSLENGKMGDTFALILSGETDMLDQLMGVDGFLGMGDGLDSGQWTEIQDAYKELIGDLKQSLDIKTKEPGDELFDQTQKLIEDHLAERKNRKPKKAADVGRDERADPSVGGRA